MELHHGKHHAANVKGANAALEKLHEIRAVGDFATITQLEKNLAFHVSGHNLHSVFWTNLSPGGGGDPTGELTDAVGATFGSVDATAGTPDRGGGDVAGLRLGAAVVGADGAPAGRATGLRIRATTGRGACRCWPSPPGSGNTPTTSSTRTSYLQYQNEKAKFFDAIWNVVDWTDVERRSAHTADLAMMAS